MELFPPLTKFYNSIANDSRIEASHISLYMALLQHWNLGGGINPIKISRSEIMKYAKINARQTYNRCMNNLEEFGYIKYEPSSNGSVQSRVILNNCEIEK
jgi:hypothetical protein